jgi:predicted RNase H-like nuclease
MKRNKKLAGDAYRIAGLLEANAVVTELRPREAEEAAADLAKVQEEIRKTVARGAVAIIQNAVQHAVENSQFQLIKFLFEIAGLYPAVSSGGETKELSLARMLCRQLGLPEDPEVENKTGSAEAKETHPTECGAVK